MSEMQAGEFPEMHWTRISVTSMESEIIRLRKNYIASAVTMAWLSALAHFPIYCRQINLGNTLLQLFFITSES